MPNGYNERPYSFHPSSMMMVLILSGITALFAALSMAYIYTRVDKGMISIRIPWLFVTNTFILAASSVCIHQCRKYFDLRMERLTLRWGYLTIIATLLFLALQGIAWSRLLSQQIIPGSSGGHGFLYAISILHFLHVFAGIPFLLRLLIPLGVSIYEGSAALFFIDDRNRRKLRHTAWYWHFIDVVWIYLVVFFLISGLF